MYRAYCTPPKPEASNYILIKYFMEKIRHSRENTHLLQIPEVDKPFDLAS